MKFDSPALSVVMPSFNQGQFIEASIKSVLDQPYPAIELIIADGGSTDSTLSCLNRLNDIYGDKLRWVSEQDSGPANAINKALRLTKSEVIGWLNSDDLYASRALSTAFLFFRTHPEIVMFYGQGEHIDAEGKSLGLYPTQPPSVSIQAFQNGCFICQPTVFLRREVFDKVSFLDESLATAFDFELWMRIFKMFPNRIAYIDKILAYSRIHADCITTRQRRLVAIENIMILNKHYGYANIHWLTTYVEELFKNHTFSHDPSDLKNQVITVLSEVEPFLNKQDVFQFKELLAKDVRFDPALPGVVLS
jgi:glycosyltransferase involved in cell wall biosynthesis